MSNLLGPRLEQPLTRDYITHHVALLNLVNQVKQAHPLPTHQRGSYRMEGVVRYRPIYLLLFALLLFSMFLLQNLHRVFSDAEMVSRF